MVTSTPINVSLTCMMWCTKYRVSKIFFLCLPTSFPATNSNAKKACLTFRRRIILRVTVCSMVFDFGELFYGYTRARVRMYTLVRTIFETKVQSWVWKSRPEEEEEEEKEEKEEEKEEEEEEEREKRFKSSKEAGEGIKRLFGCRGRDR